MKLVNSLVVALVLAGFMSLTVAHAQEASEPEAVARGMIEAFNSGDIDRFASYLSDDATATGFCRPAGVCHSKSEILAATSAEIAEGVHAEILSVSADGNTVNMRISEAAPAFSAIGIERVLIDLVFTVEDGKVTQFDDQLDLSDPQTAKFVAALEGTPEQAMQAPATGDGSSTRAARSYEWLVLSLAAAGLGSLLLGTAARRRPDM